MISDSYTLVKVCVPQITQLHSILSPSLVTGKNVMEYSVVCQPACADWFETAPGFLGRAGGVRISAARQLETADPAASFFTVLGRSAVTKDAPLVMAVNNSLGYRNWA
jgi:hypothetical protein